jgi:CRP/FNR family transcriptional regulator
VSEAIKQALDKLPIFSDLTTREVSVLADLFEPRDWHRGETLFAEGEPCQTLYFILKGEIKIFKKDKNRQYKEIATVGDRSVLGEMGFLERSLRSATAIAEQPSQGISLQHAAFERLCESDPQVAIKLLKKLNRLMALRLRKTTAEYANILYEAAH